MRSSSSTAKAATLYPNAANGGIALIKSEPRRMPATGIAAKTNVPAAIPPSS
jgi:hypothetical protein